MTVIAPANMNDEALIKEIFQISSWEKSRENEHQLEVLRREVIKRGKPDLITWARAVHQQGRQARALLNRMDVWLKRNGADEEFKHWKKEIVQQYPERVVELVNYKFSQWRKRMEARQAEGDSRKPECRIPPVVLKGGFHPNSLRHLPPHDHWDILIDETGEAFESPAGAPHKSLGRLVALAIPVGLAELPPLKPDFHASRETDEVIDEALTAVLKAPVGVVGISTRDPLAGRSPGWFTSVYHLVQLTLRLLPLKSGGNAVVNVRIEQRGVVQAGVDTGLIHQLLVHELLGLDKQRFDNLKLDIAVVGKEGHPANGYCDAVAHCWGGSNKLRLKRTAFSGHCFLTPDDSSLERLFAALDGVEPLEPADWYRLAGGLSGEPQHSLAHAMMRQLGHRVAENSALWRRYLEEVQSRLSRKSFRLPELAAALDWLDAWKPADTALPKRLQLQWHTAALASANHFGQVDLDRIAQCLELGKALWEEAAPEVCQSALRIAVACTNAFEFANAGAVLGQWRDQPAAVCGLLNRGKLLSSLGQVAAFTGDPTGAAALFDEALAHFARLSDPAEAERESAQTRIYRLIALMDQPGANPAALGAAFKQHFGEPLVQAATSLALSGDERRYEQHVLLRALVQHPGLREAREAYLRQSGEWQVGEGHPWALIHAWRGWLLLDAGQNKAAGTAFRKAVELCREDGNGPILFWMGEVLAALAARLGIGTVKPDPEVQAKLKDLLPHAPHDRLRLFEDQDADPRTALAACLPFNFR